MKMMAPGEALCVCMFAFVTVEHVKKIENRKCLQNTGT